MALSGRIAIVVAAVVATFVQILLAPYISIGYAHPNFMVVTCLVVAVIRSERYGCVLPFVMGLLYDLLSGGPVGAMAFSLTAFSVGTAWFAERAGNSTAFMDMVMMAIGLLLVEMSYGMFIILFGYSANYVEAFAFHTLPCYLYDFILAAIGYLIVHRFANSGSGTVQSEITQLQ